MDTAQLWDGVMKIRGARSINRKKEILSQYFELAPYLEMAYSPFHSYGMSKLVVPRTYGFTELTPQLLQAQLSILEQSSTIATRGAFRAFVAGLTLASQHIVACVKELKELCREKRQLMNLDVIVKIIF